MPFLPTTANLLLLLTTILAPFTEAETPVSLKNFTTGPLMNDNSITLSLERYTAYYRGTLSYWRHPLYCNKTGSNGENGTFTLLDDTYALEIGAVAPKQTKTTRAGYDSSPFWWNLARLDYGKKNEYLRIDAVSSLDKGANKGNSKTGAYWDSKLSPLPASSASSSSAGYIVNGTYIWPTVDGALGGAFIYTCFSTVHVNGEGLWENKWTFNGTITPEKAAFSLVRHDNLTDGTVLKGHVFTFEGDWVVGSAKLLVNDSASVQTEGIWEGYSATSGAAMGRLSVGGGWGLGWGILVVVVVVACSGGFAVL